MWKQTRFRKDKGHSHAFLYELSCATLEVLEVASIPAGATHSTSPPSPLLKSKPIPHTPTGTRQETHYTHSVCST